MNIKDILTKLDTIVSEDLTPDEQKELDSLSAELKPFANNNKDLSDAYKELTKNVQPAPAQNTQPPVAKNTQQPAPTSAPKEQPIATSHQTKPNLDNGEGIDNVTVHDDPIEIPSTQGNQPQPSENSENLIKQLYDISTKLQQLNKQSIESGAYESMGNIEFALLESFNLLFEDSVADQRAVLIAQANNIIKSLGQYGNDTRVADAIATAKRAMGAPAKPAPMYPVNNEKIKRFQELMAKTTTGGTQPPPGTSNAQKKSGKYDPQVEKMQEVLRDKGYDLGPRGVDGNLGSKTIAAMQAAGISGISDADIAKIKQKGETPTTHAPVSNTQAGKPVANTPAQPVQKPDAGASAKASPVQTTAPVAPKQPFKMLSPNLNPTDLINYVTKLPPDYQSAIQNFMYNNAGPFSSVTMGGPVSSKELQKQSKGVIGYINQHQMAPGH